MEKKIKMNAGVVWHDGVTMSQTARIKAIHRTMGKDVIGQFEHFEAGFLREREIEKEITIYEKIAQAFVMWKMSNEDASIRKQKIMVGRMLRYTLSDGNMFPELSKYFKK